MKKQYLILLLSILFISPLFASASAINITSPQQADRYYLGDEIQIAWRSNTHLGVRTIRIINNHGTNVYIYGPKVNGDPVNYNGFFRYKLPIYIGLFNTGNYRVELTLEDGGVFYSHEFMVINPDNPNIVVLQDAQYSITDIETKNPYYTNEPVTIGMKAWEKRGVILDSNKGFNVQARIYRGNNSQAFNSANGYFDGNKWFLQFDALSKGTYRVEISPYCSDINTTSYCANTYKDDHRSTFRETIRIQVEEPSRNNFLNDFKRWGDIKFINPREGQRTPEKIEAGQQYTLRWENIVKAEWTDVHLYKYDRKPSNDYLSNGPANVSIGTEILDLGTARLGQESLQVNLPSNLQPGYYYFRFGGKAAGDSSPAIEIVGREVSSNQTNITDSRTENRGVHLSNTQKLDLVGTIFGKDSDVYRLVSLLITLGII